MIEGIVTDYIGGMFQHDSVDGKSYRGRIEDVKIRDGVVTVNLWAIKELDDKTELWKPRERDEGTYLVTEENLKIVQRAPRAIQLQDIASGSSIKFTMKKDHS